MMALLSDSKSRACNPTRLVLHLGLKVKENQALFEKSTVGSSVSGFSNKVLPSRLGKRYGYLTN